ncbi:MAG: hypothetical protein VX202_09755 [Pseudomonadota bacterium]|jgi:hypothetical protein|nr:hypothetical protein [Pseudomonadota bacterium]
MIRRAVAFATACFAALTGPAHALSCMRPSPVNSFVEFNTRDDTYVMLYGALSFDGDAVPPHTETADGMSRADVTFTARFDGMGAAMDGFTVPVDADITVTETCLGVWCARLPADQLVLIFAAQSPDGTLSVSEGPCAFAVLPHVSEAQLDQAIACMNGKTCEAEY